MKSAVSTVFLLLCVITLLTSCQRVRGGDQTQEAIQIVHLGEAIDNLMNEIRDLQDENRILRDELQRLREGNSTSSSSESAPAQTQPLPPAPAPARMYLESDIFGHGIGSEGHGGTISSVTLRTHPVDGSFTIRNGGTYHRGLSMRGGTASQRRAWIIYDISGMGFSRLSGFFGYVGGTTSANDVASLLVTCEETGRYVGSATATERGGEVNVDISIPSDVSRVLISIQRNGTSAHSNIHIGFGNAFFE